MPVTMPGVATDYDVQGMIKKLLKAKKEPLKRFQKEIHKIEVRKEIWLTVRKKLRELAKAAKRLYDYTNPFQVMTAESSIPGSFTAEATRKAEKSRRNVHVLQTARAHRLASDSIEREKQLPGSVFTLRIGEKKAEVDFAQGGTMQELASALRLHAEEVVKTSFTFDTARTGIMVIEGMESGKGKFIRFSGDLKTLKAIGLIKKNDGSLAKKDKQDKSTAEKADKEAREKQDKDKKEEVYYRHDMTKPSAFGAYRGPGDYQKDFSIKEGSLTLKPGSRLESKTGKTLRAEDKLVLHLEVRVDAPTRQGDTNTSATNAADYDPDNVKLGPNDPVNVEDIDIFGTPLIPNEEDFEKKREELEKKRKQLEEEAKKNTLQEAAVFAVISGSGTSRREYKVQCQEKMGVWQKLNVDLSALEDFQNGKAFVFINDNARVRISYRNVFVRSHKKKEEKKPEQPQPDKKPDEKPGEAEREFIARNLMQLPRNAKLKVDGIEVARDSNNIDDLIGGVNLKLHSRGNEGLLTIDHNYKLIQEYIYEFVKVYNETFIYLEAVSEYMTREEREKLEKKLESMTDIEKALEERNKVMMDRHRGKLSGDQTLSKIKNSLRQIVMDFYPTRMGKDLGILAQIGISTSKSTERLNNRDEDKAMLELDTEKLQKMIDKDVIAVAQLFGNDRNDDAIKDTGVAKKLFDLLKVYTQAGNSGIIAVKLKHIDRLIKSKNKTLARKERSVEKYEKNLRRRFAGMESRINKYKSQGKWLKQQQGGSK